MDNQVISKRPSARRRLSRATLDEMIEEATVDAYGEADDGSRRPT